jgi:hypothetical protein
MPISSAEQQLNRWEVTSTRGIMLSTIAAFAGGFITYASNNFSWTRQWQAAAAGLIGGVILSATHLLGVGFYYPSPTITYVKNTVTSLFFCRNAHDDSSTLEDGLLTTTASNNQENSSGLTTSSNPGLFKVIAIWTVAMMTYGLASAPIGQATLKPFGGANELTPQQASNFAVVGSVAVLGVSFVVAALYLISAMFCSKPSAALTSENLEELQDVLYALRYERESSGRASESSADASVDDRQETGMTPGV